MMGIGGGKQKVISKIAWARASAIIIDCSALGRKVVADVAKEREREMKNIPGFLFGVELERNIWSPPPPIASSAK